MATHEMPADAQTSSLRAFLDDEEALSPTEAALMRDAYDADLRERIDRALDLQLAAFLATQAAPASRFAHAA
jgi:hypothetical protein